MDNSERTGAVGQFTYRGAAYRAVCADGRWWVSSDEVVATGPTLPDAMEAAFGELRDDGLRRVVAELLGRGGVD